MFKGNTNNQTAPAKRNPRKIRNTLIFYCVYLTLILAFIVGLGFVLRALNNWLVTYEAAQPSHMCQQVFNELFSDPDWEQLYSLAGVEDTKFEDSASYAAHMEKTTADAEITYVETSAGLSGDKKYIVRADGQKIASFILTPDNKDADIPTWKLGAIEVFFERNLDVTILTAPGCTVSVNGVALDDGYTIRTVSTAAENYLPEGIHGYRLEEKYVNGLLAEPTVSVTDQTGTPVELIYDSEKRTYSQDLTSAAITDSENGTLVTAAKTYCEYMIRSVGKTALGKCFDANSEIYTTIIEHDTWMQSYSSYAFGEATVSDYFRYSDDLYSARIALTLNVTRGDGTVKPYELDSTFFLQRIDGSWLVTEMTNVDIQEPSVSVRLTYVCDNTVVDTELVDASANSLTPPAVTAPAGQVFSGWFTETVDEKGNKTMSLAFLPDENGTVTLPSETTLEPMTFYALFEAEEA